MKEQNDTFSHFGSFKGGHDVIETVENEAKRYQGVSVCPEWINLAGRPEGVNLDFVRPLIIETKDREGSSLVDVQPKSLLCDVELTKIENKDYGTSGTPLDRLLFRISGPQANVSAYQGMKHLFDTSYSELAYRVGLDKAIKAGATLGQTGQWMSSIVINGYDTVESAHGEVKLPWISAARKADLDLLRDCGRGVEAQILEQLSSEARKF